MATASAAAMEQAWDVVKCFNNETSMELGIGNAKTVYAVLNDQKAKLMYGEEEVPQLDAKEAYKYLGIGLPGWQSAPRDGVG